MPALVRESSFKDEMTAAMSFLAEDERTIFLGQAVRYAGTAMSSTFDDVPDERKIEMPVAEEMQMGVSIGLAMAGYVPVSVYPRWSFLVLAASQIVNHLDVYASKVIIRVGVPTSVPLDPGPQHLGDFSGAFAMMTKKIEFLHIDQRGEAVDTYRYALGAKWPVIVSENSALYA